MLVWHSTYFEGSKQKKKNKKKQNKKKKNKNKNKKQKTKKKEKKKKKKVYLFDIRYSFRFERFIIPLRVEVKTLCDLSPWIWVTHWV